MANNIIEALNDIDVALGGTANDNINIIDSLSQIKEGIGSLKNSVDNINGMNIKICNENEYNAETGVPTIKNPIKGTFYLTPSSNAEDNNIFNEYYINDNGQWEMFGGAGIDVSSLFDLSDRMAKGVDDNGEVVEGAVIEGNLANNKALNAYAHAEGNYTTAFGTQSHAEGASNSYFSQKTINNQTYKKAGAYGEASHSEGTNALAIGYSSHAEGYDTTASGHASHAEGNYTTASNSQSHAEGSDTTASGNQSHAEGYGTNASGNQSHAECYKTTASGDNSHAEGYYTTASGNQSHAEGYGTNASGNYSHAEGNYTTANHASQHVFGEYNIADNSTASARSRGNYVEIVGNGTADNSRSNARTLDWSGNETLAGSLTLGSTTLTEANLIALLALLNNNN